MSSLEGAETLTHELTHVVEGKTAVGAVQRDDDGGGFFGGLKKLLSPGGMGPAPGSAPSGEAKPPTPAQPATPEHPDPFAQATFDEVATGMDDARRSLGNKPPKIPEATQSVKGAIPQAQSLTRLTSGSKPDVSARFGQLSEFLTVRGQSLDAHLGHLQDVETIRQDINTQLPEIAPLKSKLTTTKDPNGIPENLN